jgi:hypothetical protein
VFLYVPERDIPVDSIPVYTSECEPRLSGPRIQPYICLYIYIFMDKSIISYNAIALILMETRSNISNNFQIFSQMYFI